MSRKNISQFTDPDQAIEVTGAAPGSTSTSRAHEDHHFYKILARERGDHLFAERAADTSIFDTESVSRLNVFDIELATLQRMVIHDLQYQLVAIVKNIHSRKDTGREDMKQVRKLLQDYSTAVHNYDFMIEKKATAKAIGRQDSFRITSEEPLGFRLMDRAGLVPGKDVERVSGEVKLYEKGFNILPGDSRGQLLEAKNMEAFYDRASMGLLGGLALIGPMLIMVLKNDLLTTLIVTSVSTVIFAGVLALFGRELKGETVLASVAAYAAVLVVFIGASS